MEGEGGEGGRLKQEEQGRAEGEAVSSQALNGLGYMFVCALFLAW